MNLNYVTAGGLVSNTGLNPWLNMQPILFFSLQGSRLNTTLNTTPNQLGYKIYSMRFITSRPMPRASWGKHVLWMSSSEYLMNWWLTVWSLAKAGPNIIRACWQSPEGTTSVSAHNIESHSGHYCQINESSNFTLHLQSRTPLRSLNFTEPTRTAHEQGVTVIRLEIIELYPDKPESQMQHLSSCIYLELLPLHTVWWTLVFKRGISLFSCTLWFGNTFIFSFSNQVFITGKKKKKLPFS